jgi:hypothetical protein
VRRRGSGAHLAARTEALVRGTGLHEAGEGRGIHLDPLRLAPHLAVPVDPQQGEVVQLTSFVVAGRRHRVEILDPQHEGGGATSRHQPRHERRPEVPEVERTRG